ncbi:MAG: competence/damage-inducible protein A [Magnetococcales bacterium]|nr:competence/damage-inducible protein A [Magnetococcales bacterium]
MARRIVTKAGALIIGDEILSGYRQDAHLAHLIKTLPPLGVAISRVGYVGDDPKELYQALACSRQSAIPIFCFGGIGATEDDRTRQTAADLFNRPLTRHPEAERMIRDRFADQAEPYRIRMADLPEGCGLIPNPVNQIPGFYHDNHYFLPGFPTLAHPMLTWLWENLLTPPGHQTVVVTSLMVTSLESQLVPLMESLAAQHPTCRFFCLPSANFNGQIEFGFRSPQPNPEVLADLQHKLDSANIPWKPTAH